METSKGNTPSGRITSGANTTYWLDSEQAISFEKLGNDLDVDVVVVGGGIAGLSVAYCVLRSGKSVALVEDGLIGSGETGRTTAHLVTALDDRYYHLRKLYGKEKTELIAESHRRAIDFIETVVHNEGIDCDFERVSGYLFLHPSDKMSSLEKELTAAKEACLDVTELPDIPGMKNEPGPCLRFSNQAQFHPLKYLKGLCKSIKEGGGMIFTDTHAAQIDEHGIVSKDGYKITAKHVVIATNSPVNNKYLLHLRQYAYRTYVIGARVKKGAVPEALWWDTGDHDVNASIPPYHYVRTQSLDEDYDLLICGGEDHATGLEDAQQAPAPEQNRYTLLENWAREKFPIEDVIYHWSGQVMEPMDSLAYIGRNPMDKNNVYVVTGDSGNGMTHATIAGQLISDLINEKENKFEKIYSPSRFKLLTAGKVFIEEVVGGLVSYMKTKPRNSEDSFEDIQAGEGRIIEMEGKKYGAYRDEGNLVHIVSADCTHLGCTIKWNSGEKSWDCPCHGSRFTAKGKVINGPANEDLPYHKVHTEDFSKHINL